MYKATEIANWFLSYNDYLREIEDEDTDYISNLKLQKLLYYAQGSYLSIYDKPLFKESIEAWRHGPVVDSVYQKYKKFGSSGIDEFDKSDIDKETESLLKEVYKIFGKYSAWGLREMTHQEDPWKETDINQVISNEKIKKYFKEHYVK
ncbi:Panacea domain-containing protein [Anaerococcus vaginalis]|uniref:Panacea domain-containing protein n=1 Tax=Anaerococcus vaginalis TaxID=33037 RepID=UPI0022E55862|nr:type II toxin-antitoxin system antitoxin SocA domain-containing protein [Anaerococcus vaginalis]